MKIHHLNCATLRPYIPPGTFHVHCLLVETEDGLILVDTGFGTQDYANPTPLVRAFMAALRVRDPNEAAIRQVQRLGYQPQDVHDIIMTHMHIDHAGGLPDFPWAQVHIFHKEYDAINKPRGFMERFYIAAHWAHGPHWVQHHLEGQQWFDLDAVCIFEDPQIWIVPLPGHSRGHCGIAIHTGEGWLLHAADSTYPLTADHLGHRGLDLILHPLIGDNIPRLRCLLRDHGEELSVITSHFGQVEFDA